MAGVAQRFDLRASGAVEVVEHLRVLEEFAGVAQPPEFIDVDEVVVAAGHFGLALLARGVRDGYAQRGIALEHSL